LGARMDELRQAVQALAAAAQNLERRLSDMGDVPSRDQLEPCRAVSTASKLTSMACRPRWIRGPKRKKNFSPAEAHVNGTDIHVIENGPRDWLVTEVGGHELGHYPTQGEAETVGVALARKRKGTLHLARRAVATHQERHSRF
jgi:hypothetical protein